MGLILNRKKVTEYKFEWGGKTFLFTDKEPTFSLPHEVESFLLSLGYFRYVTEEGLPQMDSSKNLYIKTNWKDEHRMAVKEDWRAEVIDCNYLDSDFGAPICDFIKVIKFPCPVCLQKVKECPFKELSGAKKHED